MLRSHSEIIRDAGGPHALARLVMGELGGEAEAVRERVKAWNRTSSIPSEYWPALVRHEIASLEELAEAAEARKFPEVAQQRDAAA